ncbi:hypothetical protein [Neisseria sp. Ec49-e6-T10]|uniref:hypothetical protein n=1 Tax=Neisseria sp. Ec49-e6-T10 TaxID=3140744 RepID=UPI003EC0ABBF
MFFKAQQLKRQQEKELLLLKGEALRIQLLLDVHASKQKIQSNRFLWTLLGSSEVLALLLSTFFRKRKGGIKMTLAVSLVSLVLWFKKKLK